MKTSDIEKLTPDGDVSQVLVLLSENLQSILGKQLIGLYLTGSLTYGDFDRGRSDIDFLAVVDQKLTTEQLKHIESMHRHIGKSVPVWSKRLEGSYVTKDMLASIERPRISRPYVNGGKLSHFKYGNEWLLNLYVLQECGIALFGLDPKTVFPPVDINLVREASKKDLLEDWAPKDSSSFESEEYESAHMQAYAILTMCRILYREFNDDVASKRKSSAWVKTTYEEWRELIEKAENWQHGQEIDAVDETLDFIKFTLNKVQ